MVLIQAAIAASFPKARVIQRSSFACKCLWLTRGSVTTLFFLLSLVCSSEVAPFLAAKLFPLWAISPFWHYFLGYSIKYRERFPVRNKWPFMRLFFANVPQSLVEAVTIPCHHLQLNWHQPPCPQEVSSHRLLPCSSQGIPFSSLKLQVVSWGAIHSGLMDDPN